MGVRDLDVIHELDHVLRQRGEIIGPLRGGGEAMAAGIETDDAEVRGQGRHLRRPEVRMVPSEWISTKAGETGAPSSQQ